MKEKYQLREAAGCFWLLDMEQDGKNFRKPLMLNKSGAAIWKLLCDGKDPKQIAEYLKKTYDISGDEAKEDVRLFLESLKKEGILR